LAAKQETSGLPLTHPSADQEGIQEYERQQIEAFVRGEMSGFKFIYNRHRQQVYSYCLYYTGEKVAAEDAFQEVFTRVYTHRDQLREPKALKSWLLLITRSVCLNSLRTSKFTPDFVPISSESNTENERPEPKELTVDPRETQSSGELLKLALARLAPMYREAFLLREFEGYSYDEIAEQVGISVMNVKVRITRAKKQLRTILSPHFGNKQSKRRKTKSANGEITDGVLESDLESDEDESAEEETGEAVQADDSGENDAVMDSQPRGKRNLLRDEQEEFDDGE
jgi:RNA polymerase sigma-70 factor (ECF subfamily)